jgi:membrane associated rhomboid family serine protease
MPFDYSSGVWFLVVSGVLIGFASYMMTPEERVRALAAVRAYAARFTQMALGGAVTQPFGKALAERTRWPLVAPAIAAFSVIVFLSISLGRGSPSGTDGTIAWGGNIGPLTTNGGWHRLVAATFVHPHLIELIATLAGLAAFGLIAERLIGSVAFATVCMTAAIVGSLVSLNADPLRLSYGASAAVFGIYGFLLAAACRVFITTRAPLIPWHIFRPLAPVAGVFVLYALAAPSMMARAELAAVLTGIICGVALSKDIQKGKPSLKMSGRLAGVTAVVAIAAAFMLRGIDDGRPEVAAVTALEERTAREYEKEIDRYRAGGSSADQLIRTIERTIVPELQAAQERIEQLDRVPEEQRPSIDHTNQYLRQRQQSWQLRVDGLRQRAILEARQAGKKAPSSGPPLSANKLLEKSTTALLSAEGAERSALKDLRAAAAILQ